MSANELELRIKQIARIIDECGCSGYSSATTSSNGMECPECRINKLELIKLIATKEKGSDINSTQVGGSHYLTDGQQHWDRAWQLYREAWFVLNITKYAERYRKKNGIQDLLKAKQYLEKLIELETKDLEKAKEQQ